MRNLVNLYNKADKNGVNWYRETHELCRKLSDKYNVELSKVCGIFSALSPATNFEQNKKDVVAMLEIFTRGHTHRKHKFSTYGNNVIKAWGILKGELLEPFSPKTGAKTFNFYYNLLEPENPDFVTVDRWAYTIATGETYKSLTPKQYGIVADHYRKSAKKLGILPNELQAVLWVDYRNKQNINFTEYCPF